MHYVLDEVLHRIPSDPEAGFLLFLAFAVLNALGFLVSLLGVVWRPRRYGLFGLVHALINLISCVKTAVSDAGYEPRLASDREFHPGLWDNVVLYMLGCERGVAIVEDKYRDEFNPNVAMEWGWMRGMRREVLFLVEKDFGNQRADVSGLISKAFDWDDPRDAVRRAVSGWLQPGG